MAALEWLDSKASTWVIWLSLSIWIFVAKGASVLALELLTGLLQGQGAPYNNNLAQIIPGLLVSNFCGVHLSSQVILWRA